MKSMYELPPSKCSSSRSSALIKMTNKWSNITWSHCIAYKPFLTLCFTYDNKKELLRSLKYLKYLRYIQKGRSLMKYLKFYQGDHHWSALFLTSSSFLPCPLKSWLTPAMPAAFTIALKKQRINLFCFHYVVTLQKFSYLDVELRWIRFEDDIWLKLGP